MVVYWYCTLGLKQKTGSRSLSNVLTVAALSRQCFLKAKPVSSEILTEQIVSKTLLMLNSTNLKLLPGRSTVSVSGRKPNHLKTDKNYFVRSLNPDDIKSTNHT